MRLESIKTLGIIGGGIAGLSFLNEISRNWSHLPKIIVFDPRFGDSKPVRPNRTSGLIYHSLAEKYNMLSPDASVIAQELETITFHKDSLAVEIPDPVGRKIYTVSKNAFQKDGETIESVYEFLQNQLLNRDEIEYRNAYVLQLRFPSDTGGHYTIVYKQGPEGLTETQDVDAVILTTRPLAIEKTLRKRIKYVPPRTWPGAVVDISLENLQDRSKFQTLHKFLIGGGKAHTLDMVPHGEILTVTAVGKEMTLGVLMALLEEDSIKKYLPHKWKTRISKEAQHEISVPVSGAKNFVHHGFAGLGGQVFGEILINGGLYNTLWASKILCEVIRDHGLGKEALSRWYYMQIKNRLRFQNWIGRTAYHFSDSYVLPSPRFSGFFLSIMESENALPCKKRYMSQYVWDLLVGERLFTSAVCRMVLSFPVCVVRKLFG